MSVCLPLPCGFNYGCGGPDFSGLYVPKFKGDYIQQLEELKDEIDAWVEHRWGEKRLSNEDFHRQREMLDYLEWHKHLMPIECYLLLKDEVTDFYRKITVTMTTQSSGRFTVEWEVYDVYPDTLYFKLTYAHEDIRGQKIDGLFWIEASDLFKLNLYRHAFL